jgi:phospholipid transport system substrate-binding protein
MTCLPHPGFADQPIDVLKKSIDQSISILNDPAFSDARQKASQRQELWQILKLLFDFEEFSKRVLARNWHKFTTPQQAEFVELFGNFVHIYYLSRLQDKYNNETITFLDQNLISDSRAVVNVEVIWKYKNIPVEVKMLKRGDSWKVYDLSALGISAVSFYRSQFRAVLRKESPRHVLDILKGKIKKSEEKVQQKYSQ